LGSEDHSTRSKTSSEASNEGLDGWQRGRDLTEVNLQTMKSALEQISEKEQ
jgi:hypothetical protein